MNSTQQQCFLKAAELLNFTAAAEALFISQPALSRNIAALEEELELLLFVRRNNILALTPGGEIIYRWMKDSENKLQTAIREAKKANAAPQGTLRLGFVKTELASQRDTRAIAAFRKAYPDVLLSVSHFRAQEIIRHLTDHSIDIAIMIGSAAYGDVRLQYYESAVYHRCIAVAVSHPLAERATVSLREFQEDTFISVEESASPTMNRMVTTVCGAAGFVPRLRETKNTGEQISLLEAGQGVALLVENHSGRVNPLLRFIPLEEDFPVSLLCVWDRLNQNPSLQDYLEIYKSL